MYRPECGFRLSDDVQSYGLDCSKTGLALAGVPLLYQGNVGFSARRPEETHWLLSSAYQRRPNVGAIAAGLNAVARALNAGEIGRAMIAAILLKLPDLDWDGAARIAQAEDVLAKYDPDEPRDWHGRWTSNPPLRLPPGHRIDELGDLLEWIANARPEEAPIIRGEIKRYYYDVGDVRGGNALNEALSNIVYGDPTRAERQDVLDTFEVYTKADPADIAQIGRDLFGDGIVAAARSGAGIGGDDSAEHLETRLGGTWPPYRAGSRRQSAAWLSRHRSLRQWNRDQYQIHRFDGGELSKCFTTDSAA